MRWLKTDIMSLVAFGLLVPGLLLYRALSRVNVLLTPVLARSALWRVLGRIRKNRKLNDRQSIAGWPGLSADAY